MTIFSCTFTAPGNPDYRQYAPIAPNLVAFGFSVDEIKEAAERYISRFDLGGGNWSSPLIYDEEGRTVGRLAYNGRIFQEEMQ